MLDLLVVHLLRQFLHLHVAQRALEVLGRRRDLEGLAVELDAERVLQEVLQRGRVRHSAIERER